MKRFSCPIFVTRPYLPDIEEFKDGVEDIWRNRWLTNNGPMVQRFAAALSQYLGVPETNLALFNNGTLALELGYYAMGLAGGEVVTTPFTFVATSHALKRIGATPVFADIDPETLCLDPAKVEKLITPRTKAIVPVHVYGHVCDIEGFDRLSEKYGIPVIYDAAHAFGVGIGQLKCEVEVEERNLTSCAAAPLDGAQGLSALPGADGRAGRPLPAVTGPHNKERDLHSSTSTRNFDSSNIHSSTSTLNFDSATTIGVAGAMSMFSFHPTKLFHSCEGGLLVFKDKDQFRSSTSTQNFDSSLQNRLFDLRNFAIHSETECVDVGSNAKMNELQALMGLCCLKKMPELLAWRQSVYDTYKEVFDNPSSTSTSSLSLLPYSANHAYVPVLFKDFATREKVYAELKEKCNVFSRRYFYPLLTDFAPYVYAKGTCPIAEDIASRVLTLPTYHGLAPEDAKAIAENVLEIVGKQEMV